MITSENIHAALGGPAQRASRELIPSIFDDIQPLDFAQMGSTECEQYVKPGLTTIGSPTCSTNAGKDYYYKYVRAGYRKAVPEDFIQREDGTDGCQVPYDTAEQGYFEGDIVIMVCDKRVKLGHQFKAYLDANAPTWSKEDREKVAARLSAKALGNVALVDAVDQQPHGGTRSPATGMKAQQQAYNLKTKSSTN